MIEESLLKSNFIGRDGFRWWIGQIPPGDSLGAQNKGGGWGNRFKVRILGYHPYSKADLPDEDLPWAGCLLPATSGTGASNFAESVKYRPGDVVVGFFMDGDNAQIPMIMGAFGRTSQVPQQAASGAFVPFTGYTSNIDIPDGTLDPDESNEQNKDSQPSPRSISGEQAGKINSSGNGGKTEIAASKADGQKISPANACDDNFIDEVSNVLENFFGGIPKNPLGGIVGEAADFLGDVSAVTKNIQRLANNPVSSMMDSLYRELIPALQKGLDALFNATFQQFLQPLGKLPAIGKAVDAVKSMVPPIFRIQEQLECLPGKIISGLGDTIKGMVEGALIDIVNFGTCIVEQFAGDLLNKITDQIVDGLSGVLDGIQPILDLVTIDVREILSASADVIASAAGFFDCNQDKGKCTGRVRKWTLGYGADGSFDLKKTYDNVANQINVKNALGLLDIDVPQGVNSPFTKPDCATPPTCGGPTVKIFGGDGIGGAGRAILGGIVSNTPDLDDLSRNVTRTASIIGVELTDPGSKYFYKEPLVSFSDSCGLGYGAVAKAIIDFPTGQIKNIVMLSEGENYPVGAGTDDDDESPLDPNIPVGIIDIEIPDPGDSYEPDDTRIIIDPTTEPPPPFNPEDPELGTPIEPDFDIVIEDGRIISVKPINIIQVNVLPKLRVVSGSGSGALLKPIIGRLPESKPGQKLIQVIDCVT
jgi:hypothetical protein